MWRGCGWLGGAYKAGGVGVFFIILKEKTQGKMEIDLLHPDPKVEERTHKLKRLVQAPNSYFMDVKCNKCMNL